MAISTHVAVDGDPYVAGVLSGLRWRGTLTFGFPDNANEYGKGYGAGEPWLGFSPASAALQLAVSAVVLGIPSPTSQGFGGTAMGVRHFTLLDVRSTEAGGLADIRIALSAKPSTAWTYRLERGQGGDIWFGKAYAATNNNYQSPVLGAYSYLTVMHELGHALGLKHSNEAGSTNAAVVPSDKDALEFTVMSYRSYAGGPTGGYAFEKYGAPQSFMMLDIAALQLMYGANFAHNAGGTIYSWDPSDGTMSINGVRQATPGGNRVFETVWDGGGTDTYDFSNYSEALGVDLLPGRWSTLSRAQLTLLGPGVHAQGSVYNALQYAGDPRSLIENAIGGSGNDLVQGNDAANRLVGNVGADTLIGGAGCDTLEGSDSNDVLGGGPGDDALDGGAGHDTAAMGDVGFRRVGVGLSGGKTVLTSAAGTDTLADIEVVTFADGRLVFDPSDPAAQATRLYEAALDRLPDQGGLNFWIEAVRHDHALSELAQGFLASAEFQARFGGATSSNGAFVDQLYLNVLGRTGEPGGRDFWVNSLNAGAGRADVLAAFSESAENKAGTAGLVQGGIWDRSEAAAEVARLYDTVFGRLPDAPGLVAWKGELEGGRASLVQVADAFMKGAEFQSQYGALDNRDFAGALYVNTLNRAADQAGLDHWTNALNVGASRAEVVLAFSESQEHVALTAPNVQSESPGEFGILFA